MRDDVVFLGLVLIPLGASAPLWVTHPALSSVNVLNLAVGAVATGLMLLFVVAPLLSERLLRGERKR